MTEHKVTVTVDESQKDAYAEFTPKGESVADRLPTEATCQDCEWEAHGEQAGVRALASNHEAGTDR